MADAAPGHAAGARPDAAAARPVRHGLSFQTSFLPCGVITDGGPPENATPCLPVYVYRRLQYLRFGAAAAGTVAMLA